MIHSGRLGRTHLSPPAQDDFITAHGEQCQIWSALQCPCLLTDRRFDPVCPACHGSGRYYADSLAFVRRLLLVRELSSRTYGDPGTWMSGTIQMTMPWDLSLGDRDKVRRLEARETFTDEVLERGGDETLRFSGSVSLTLVADRGRVYRPGIDYILEAPNTVAWVSGGAQPAFLSQYSVRYDAQPDYLVNPDNPRTRVEASTRQSQVVTMRRLDYVTDEDG